MGSGYVIERPLQRICDLEIAGSREEDRDDGTRNDRDQRQNVVLEGHVAERGRSSRSAKTATLNRLVGVMANEED